MYAGGQVDAKHLQEFAADTGFNLSSAMMSAGGFKNKDELEHALSKKGNYHGEKSLDLLEKAMAILTGPGGAAYQHSLAQLDGWKGIMARWSGHMEDFKESFGKQLESFLTPIANKIFDFLTPAALTHAFDGLQYIAKMSGEIVSEIAGVVGTRVPLMFGAFQDSFTGLNKWLDSMLVEVNDPVTGIHKVLRADPFAGVNAFLNELHGLIINEAIKDFADFSLGNIGKGIVHLFKDLKEFAELYSDLKSGNLGKFWSDINKYEFGNAFGSGPYTAQSASVQAAQDKLNSLVNAGADDFQITKAKDELLAAEKAQRDSQDKNKAAIDSVTTALQGFQAQLQALNPTMTPTGSVTGSPSGSLSDFTKYGPAIDPKGSRYYDSDSYNGIGHAGGRKFNLNSEASGVPAAMKAEYARNHYHVGAGGWYKSDKDGKMHRYMDTTGAKNRENEDIYYRNSGASINVTNHFTIQAIDTHGIDRVLTEHSSKIAHAVKREFRQQSSASAVV
jgi:hypothetical protein